MKAFVLAAGFGTRLRPLTEHLPKPLMPVLNVPGLFYTFSLLKQAGISRIICNIHHHAAAIRRFVEEADLEGLEISFSEEPVILGTGGGLKRCEKLLDDDHFILVNSDIITDIDFRALVDAHRNSGLQGTLCLHSTPRAQAIGAVGVQDGLVRDFRNMRNLGSASPFIYTGSAVLSPEIFRFLRPEFSGIVETGFLSLADAETLGFYEHQGLWQDIGTPESYWQANTAMPAIAERLAPRMEATLGIRPTALWPEADIASSAELTDSVVGAGCSIGAGCRIAGSVILPGTVIEAGTTLIRTIADPQHRLVLTPTSATQQEPH